MLLPEFTENTEKSMLLYFDAEGRNTDGMMDELEKTYACMSSMKKTVKNGKTYVVLEVEDCCEN